MIAGKPGAFKSVIALNMLVRWAQAGYPIMYFSADSDEHTVARRLAGIITGTEAAKVEADFEDGRFAAYMDSLETLHRVRFEYRSTLAIDEIFDRLHAYDAVYGDFPAVVFIDNLMDFAESATDWEGMVEMTKELDSLARETRSHICILHHASEGWGKAADPVPRAAIQGKVSQKPRLTLTVAASGMQLALAVVKNTNGPQDPDARRPLFFTVEPSLRVTDKYTEAM